jgi:hypothetical protein
MKAGPRKLRVTVTVEDLDSSSGEGAPSIQEVSSGPSEPSVNGLAEIARWLLWWLPWNGS